VTADTHDAGLSARLARIEALTAELLKTQDDSKSCRDLAVKILAEVEAARSALKPLNTNPSSKPR
jgi:hypothetical protein